MIDHPFNKLLLRCERADKQIKEYQALWTTLQNAYPNKVTPQFNAETGYTDFYLTQMTPIDPELCAIAGEAIHNLRSALDNLAWQLVIENGCTPGTHTGFPIFDTAAEYSHPKTGAARKVKGMHQYAIDMIGRLNPYEAGNRPLWLLHKLDIIDKHRLLLAAGQVNVAAIAPKGCTIIHGSSTGDLVLLKEGEKVFSVSNLEFNDNVQFVMDVSLNETQLTTPFPLFMVLSFSVLEVRRIIRDFGRFLKP